MSQPFDSATTQQSVANVLQEQYFDTYIEETFFEGRVTNRLVRMADEPIVGDGQNFQVEVSPGDHIRMDTDALSDFPSPARFTPDKFKLRWNERDPTSHDFVKLAGTGRVSIYEMDEASSEGAIVDIADRIYNEIAPDYDFKLALMRNADRTALVANTPSSGTVKYDADTYTVGDAHAYTTGGTSARVKITSGAIAAFRPGTVWDIYDTNGLLVFSGARVTHYNPGDFGTGYYGSVAFTRDSASSTATFDSVTTACKFYVSGSKNKGMYGFGAWFSNPASGDSFIGGKNRTTLTNSYLVPQHMRQGATARKVLKSDLDDAGDAMQFIQDRKIVVTAVMDPRLLTSLRSAIGEAAFIQWPSGDDRASRYANFGSMGLTWQHPTFGLVSFQADQLITPGTLRLLVPEDWRAAYRGTKGLRFLKDGGNMWILMESTTPGNGKSMFYQCYAYANHCDVCLRPRRQCQIDALTA